MVCLAVRSAFGLQGRNFVHEDREALGPDVIMLIEVCKNECHRAWVETTSVLQHRTFSLFCRRQGMPLFVLAMALAFGRSYEVHDGFV